jgi:hypothetical protein
MQTPKIKILLDIYVSLGNSYALTKDFIFRKVGYMRCDVPRTIEQMDFT